MASFSKVIELKGHIIDSLTFPKVLDEILDRGGNYITQEISIGKTKTDPSYARVKVSCSSRPKLEEILTRLYQLGATPLKEREVTLKEAPQAGILPTGFYVTTGLSCEARFKGRWLAVADICPDCAIRVDERTSKAQAVKFHQVAPGDKIVVGSNGVRVSPLARFRPRGLFDFPARFIAADKAKGSLISEVALEIERTKAGGGKILLAAGEAVGKAGCREQLCRLIEVGYTDILIAGNDLASSDLAISLFGLPHSNSAKKRKETRTQRYLEAINEIKQAGGVKKAIASGLVKKGIFYSLDKAGGDFLLLGNPSDDGPLPEVVTDTVQAQMVLRKKVRGVKLVLVIASHFHAKAVGKALPASVRGVVVDINPTVVSKFTDRVGFQTLGLVTDAELFLKELVSCLCPGRERNKRGR